MACINLLAGGVRFYELSVLPCKQPTVVEMNPSEHKLSKSNETHITTEIVGNNRHLSNKSCLIKEIVLSCAAQQN